MDPTANLREQLELAKELMDQLLSDEVFEDKAGRLAELVETLNDWIERGGFLPEQWTS